MAVQFAVLASGSRGNSTLICGKGAGLLIDVGIGPKALGERLESVGSSWSRIALGRPDAHPWRSRRHGDFQRAGPAGVTRALSRRTSARHWPATPGFEKLEEARTDPLLRRSSVP